MIVDRERLNLKLLRWVKARRVDVDSGEGKMVEVRSRPITVEVQRWWRSCCGLFRGRPRAPAAAANGLSTSPGNMSAKRGPYGAVLQSKPALARPPKYRPSRCQVPARCL